MDEMEGLIEQTNARVLQMRRREAQSRGPGKSNAMLAIAQAHSEDEFDAVDAALQAQGSTRSADGERNDEFNAAIASLLVANENSIIEADSIPQDGSTDWAGNPVPDDINPARHPPSTPPPDLSGEVQFLAAAEGSAAPAVLLKSPGQDSTAAADAILFAGSTSGGGDFDFG